MVLNEPEITVGSSAKVISDTSRFIQTGPWSARIIQNPHQVFHLTPECNNVISTNRRATALKYDQEKRG